VREAVRSRYNDVLDFDSSSAILKIEWREEDLGFTSHVQPFLSPVPDTLVFNSPIPVLVPRPKFITPSCSVSSRECLDAPAIQIAGASRHSRLETEPSELVACGVLFSQGAIF